MLTNEVTDQESLHQVLSQQDQSCSFEFFLDESTGKIGLRHAKIDEASKGAKIQDFGTVELI